MLCKQKARYLYKLILFVHVYIACLHAIKADHPRSVRSCLKEVVHQWFTGKGSGPPSWKSLCAALRRPLIGREDVASKIEKKYVIDYLHKEREGGE